ncbi:MAG: aldehyde dehydrogenase family protein, partial [Saprospiraceae bacterium]|nr:aldehyde dehydrogenase family protein [Saprospiraceae bacterium]
MEFKSINPYNGQVVGQYISLTPKELEERLDKSRSAFEAWREVPISERCALLRQAGVVLRDHMEE